MKSACLKTAVLFLLLVLLSRCIEPYLPQEITSADNYLVVDALLELGNDSLTVRLSRTQQVTPKSAAATGLPESQAKVSLEGDQGSRFVFVETSKGTYQMSTPALKEAEQYRLSINTSASKEYSSEYVPVKKSPPIDELTYRITPGRDGVKILVSTHDPQNQIAFYRWKFEETFEYRALYYNTLEVVTNPLTGERSLVDLPKAKEDTIKICWRTEKPLDIVLGTSINLRENAIQDLPILEVPASSHKLLYDYSILVKQYALTKEAYAYWTSLAKTTETTGSLFDPMPSRITGNVSNRGNPKEPVFGYFGIFASTQKRLSIREYLGLPEACPPGECCVYPLFDVALQSTAPIYGKCTPPPPKPGQEPKCILDTHYIRLSPACTDCRAAGGTTKKPDFMK